MRNTDAEKKLKEAWNKHSEKYDALLKIYKDQNYKITRNDKTGNHIVEKASSYDLYKDTPFGNMFNFGG